MIPVLETERMILRPPALADFPAHAAIWADPRTTQPGFVYDEELVWLRFQRHLGQWTMFGYGSWGIEERGSGRYIGMMGFFNARRAIDATCRDLPEAGWMIAPDLHRRGLAGEGLAPIFAWADTHIAAPETWCMIDPANETSQRLALRLGHRRDRDTVHKGKPMQVYRRSRGAQS